MNDVLDPAALERVDFVARRGDPLLLARLVDLFLADAPERLRGLRDAFEDHDDARLRALAHGLRGSSETVGAHEMAAHCDFLEHMPSEWATAEIALHLAGLIEAFTRTQAALENLVAHQARSDRDAPP